jgi:hypothetical protein
MERGKDSGHADRSYGCCRLRSTGAAATFLFTLERPWRGAMKPRKWSGSLQQGPRNSRASLRTNPEVDSDIKQMSGRRQAQPESRQLRRDGSAG